MNLCWCKRARACWICLTHGKGGFRGQGAMPQDAKHCVTWHWNNTMLVCTARKNTGNGIKLCLSFHRALNSRLCIFKQCSIFWGFRPPDPWFGPTTPPSRSAPVIWWRRPFSKARHTTWHERPYSDAIRGVSFPKGQLDQNYWQTQPRIEHFSMSIHFLPTRQPIVFEPHTSREGTLVGKILNINPTNTPIPKDLTASKFCGRGQVFTSQGSTTTSNYDVLMGLVGGCRRYAFSRVFF